MILVLFGRLLIVIKVNILRFAVTIYLCICGTAVAELQENPLSSVNVGLPIECWGVHSSLL